MKKNSFYFPFKSLTPLLPLLIVLHTSLPLSSRIIGVDVVFCVIFMHAAILNQSIVTAVIPLLWLSLGVVAAVFLLMGAEVMNAC